MLAEGPIARFLTFLLIVVVVGFRISNSGSGGEERIRRERALNLGMSYNRGYILWWCCGFSYRACCQGTDICWGLLAGNGRLRGLASYWEAMYVWYRFFPDAM